MASTIKLLASEVSLSDTASNVSFAHVVRVYNANGADQVVTVKDDAGTPNTIGTVTVKNGEVVYIQKEARHTLAVGAAVANVKAVKVAHTN